MEMPIFPLGTVLFPGGVLPLKIFEQRYLDMTKACVRDGSAFGICMIREGREVGAPALPSEIGCVARIREWDMPQLGIFLLLTEGVGRFRLGKRHHDRAGLMIGEIEMLPDAAPTPPPPEADRCVAMLRAIVEKIGEDKLPSPPRFEDPAWVAYRLAEFLPLEALARQRLLEMDSADLLMGVVAKLLRQQGLSV
ncbi:MAG: LON peptidase substrate-binding domain-containing protein [Proteobacteria bacterium]|nr:LON peptidase substrate-binding domain-containing protein [Burkholderiales bacterium]